MNNLVQFPAREEKTITTQELHASINDAREQKGEKAIRLNDFIARAADELEGDHYETFVVQNSNNTESTHFKLSLEQAGYIAMRESKAVRRSVCKYIKSLESSSPKIPQTMSEALQLAADQAKALELAAPKVEFVDRMVDRGTLMTATQVAQKHKMSAVKLNRFLDELGGVYSKSVKRSRVFTQSFIDSNRGEMKQSEQGYSQPLFTAAGEVWIFEKLISEGGV